MTLFLAGGEALVGMHRMRCGSRVVTWAVEGRYVTVTMETAQCEIHRCFVSLLMVASDEEIGRTYMKLCAVCKS